MALHEKQTKKSKKGGGDTDRHVPYRNSMLTSVLRDSLGGNCKTVMVATVHPAVTHTDESISTCKFAQRVAMVRNEVSRNEEVDHAALISRLRRSEPYERREGLQTTMLPRGCRPKSWRHFMVRSDRSYRPRSGGDGCLGQGTRAARVRHAMWIMKGLLREGWKPHQAPSAEAWTVGLHERAGQGGGSGRHGGSEEEPQVDLSAGEDLGSPRTHAFGEDESSSGGRDGGSAEQAAQNEEEWAQRREMLRRAAVHQHARHQSLRVNARHYASPSTPSISSALCTPMASRCQSVIGRRSLLIDSKSSVRSRFTQHCVRHVMRLVVQRVKWRQGVCRWPSRLYFRMVVVVEARRVTNGMLMGS